jgi:hypothetical protein
MCQAELQIAACLSELDAATVAQPAKIVLPSRIVAGSPRSRSIWPAPTAGGADVPLNAGSPSLAGAMYLSEMNAA